MENRHLDTLDTFAHPCTHTHTPKNLTTSHDPRADRRGDKWLSVGKVAESRERRGWDE